MNNKKIGNFLIDLRNEFNLTQEELSQKISVSRTAISKWERGINVPPPEVLLELSKIYNVSVNEILNGERDSNNNIKTENKKNKKKLITIILSFVMFLVAFFFFLYFLNNYNSIYVYRLTAENENFYVHDGLVIFSKDKSYMRLGTIKSFKDLEYLKFEIFYYDENGLENLIFESNDDNYTLISRYGNDQYFSYDIREWLIQNSYIRIYYDDKIEILKLFFQEDMRNNKFFYQKLKGDNQSPDQTFEEPYEVKQIETYVDNNFTYNKEEDSYFLNITINGNKVDIRYLKGTKTLIIREHIGKEIHIMTLWGSFNSFEYEIYRENGYLEYVFNYDILGKKCLKGDCSNPKKEYFLETYYNKFISY